MLELFHAHLAIELEFAASSSEALGLMLSGSLHTTADGGRTLLAPLLAQLGVIDLADFQPQVDAVSDGAGDLAAVAVEGDRRTDASFAPEPPIAAGARVHGRDEDELGREDGGTASASDMDDPIF